MDFLSVLFVQASMFSVVNLTTEHKEKEALSHEVWAILVWMFLFSPHVVINPKTQQLDASDEKTKN